MSEHGFFQAFLAGFRFSSEGFNGDFKELYDRTPLVEALREPFAEWREEWLSLDDHR